MKDMGFSVVAEPSDGRIELTFNADDEAAAGELIGEYLDMEDKRYAGAFDEKGNAEEELFVAAIAFVKARRAMHFFPTRGIQWMIDSSSEPSIEHEWARNWASDNTELVFPEEREKTARERMTARRAAAGQFGKEAQIAEAVGIATLEELARAITDRHDSEEVICLIGLMQGQMSEAA